MKQWLGWFGLGMLLLAGCRSWGPAEPPQVRLVLDREYQPAIGGGFHWRVESNLPPGTGSLRLSAGEALVGGSEGGLPSDIYVGWLDWESLKFFYPELEFPANEVAVRLIMCFDAEKPGSASGWLETGEGENVLFSGDITLSAAFSEAALLEFNVAPVRLGLAERKDGKLVLRENQRPENFTRKHSLRVHFSPDAIPPGTIRLQEITPGATGQPPVQ